EVAAQGSLGYSVPVHAPGHQRGCRCLQLRGRWPERWRRQQRRHRVLATESVKRVRRHAAGFTLIELMVAILIAGILMTVVGLSVRGSDRSLQFEADRIGQLLALAREEAQVRGARIRFEADVNEYRFLIRRQGKWVPILDDRDLRARAWAGPTILSLQRSDGRQVIEFG